mmetsp:Transcript_56626/g.164099  ORF Transcript_56626/g.164099 Transcript_56626/m.164099 type:complete len:267 (+) Transcript_56626:86-886(+)
MEVGAIVDFVSGQPADGLFRECTDTRQISDILNVFAANIARESEAETQKSSAPRSAARGGIPPVQHIPPFRFSDKSLLRECTDKRGVSEILEAFFMNIEPDEDASAVERWGDKVGYSVFDEEEIFGRCRNDDDLDELFDEFFDEEDADVGEGDDSDWESESEPEDVYGWPLRGNAAGREHWKSAVPRAVKLIEPLCFVDTLERNATEKCAVCLEAMTTGHGVWRLPCMHTFHEVCAMRCFGTRHAKAACPVCRCNIKRVHSGMASA